LHDLRIDEWLSDNGGERWQMINAHLPPIYALRFA